MGGPAIPMVDLLMRFAEGYFFRPTPYSSCQVVKQAGKLLQIGKFSELMQWQHPHIDNVHQK